MVVWIDSSLQNGQVGRDELPRPELIKTIGWMVERTEHHVTVARDDMKDDEYRGLCCIPVECIKTLTPLAHGQTISSKAE